MKRLLIGLLGVALFAAMALAVGEGVAFGSGTIQMPNRALGVFSFHAGSFDGNIRGFLNFREVLRSNTGREKTIHTVRLKVEKFECRDKNAVFSGPALFDGRQAYAEVFVSDRWYPGSPLDVLDHFEMKVFSPDGNAVYRAGGPVRGDIVVRCGPPPGRL
ncbi:MAG: hypothetical protein HRF45_08615 [Fimbriimonadia bacterium]|jgi:hypothetical protein